MSTINQQPVPDEKRLCTGDVWCGCTCHACTVTFEHCVTPTPAVSDKLGTELLFDGLANLLTMAREDLSDLFEALPRRCAAVGRGRPHRSAGASARRSQET